MHSDGRCGFSLGPQTADSACLGVQPVRPDRACPCWWSSDVVGEGHQRIPANTEAPGQGCLMNPRMKSHNQCRGPPKELGRRPSCVDKTTFAPTEYLMESRAGRGCASSPASMVAEGAIGSGVATSSRFQPWHLTSSRTELFQCP